MGIPAQADTTKQNSGTEQDTDDNKNHADDVELTEEERFTTAISEAVAAITRGDDGKYILPEGLSLEMRMAVIAEKRRRDTQSEFTKTSQKAKALEAENTALKKRAIGNVKIDLTPELKEELEELKFSDPEEWRKRMNKLEQEAFSKHQKELDEEMGQVSTEILNKEELARREEVLKEFMKSHEGFTLNDDILANDIPPRFTKRLETGAISFETFLQEVYDYTKTGKVVKQEDVLGQPNLSKVGGGTAPEKHAESVDIIKSYEKEVF